MFASGAIVRPSKWQAMLAMEDVTDNITIRNLQITANAGLDVWGRRRTQPALLTVIIYLAKPFDSAAKADALDESTVHYGKLSKNIRSALEKDIDYESTEELAAQVYARILETAGKADLKAVEIDIFYPKACMLGNGAGYVISCFTNPEHGKALSRVVYLRDVRIPCIIGVNANERQQKQPVVVNLWIECLPSFLSEYYTRFATTLCDAIIDSSFETLESLSTAVVQALRKRCFEKYDAGSYIRLRIEKPMAIPFADAPSIEIVRRVQE